MGNVVVVNFKIVVFRHDLNLPSVFVSHSKHDVDRVNYFAKIFARIGLQTHLMELEDIDNLYAGVRIANIIRSNSAVYEDTRAVLVLLGKSLEKPPDPQYTHNWVNYEVGVSAGCNKPVWVFEQFNEFINFPIPYVTNYCLYTLEDKGHAQIIGDYLKKLYVLNQILPSPHRIKCGVCNAEYNYWSNQANIHCPVCRQEIIIPL